VEGLIVCRDDVIATANNSFAALAGDDEVVGTKFETFFPGEALRARLLARPNHPIEAELRGRDGSIIPVELILRFIDFEAASCHCRARLAGAKTGRAAHSLPGAP